MLLTMKQDDSPYYTHLKELNLSPGWARPEPSMWPSPQPKFKPAVWRFADAKKALDASHNMVPADQTERRNLILVNPIEGNTYATTRHLVAAYQCVMPGDRARTHRHSAAALRLVLQRAGGRLHHRQRHPHRHAAGRSAADAGLVLARPRQRHRLRPATGSTSSTFRSCSSPRRCSSSPIRRAASRPSPRSGPTPMRIPSRDALGPGTDAKTVEIGKGVMPTIALNLIRQPKGGSVQMPKTTANVIYAVVSGKARFIAEGFDADRGRRRRRRHAVLARAHHRGAGEHGGVQGVGRSDLREARARASRRIEF